MGMLKKVKKKISSGVEYICPNCKTKEIIPKDVVDYFDEMDSIGVDNSYPPMFKCINCNNDMVPVFYKSIHGFIHEYKDI